MSDAMRAERNRAMFGFPVSREDSRGSGPIGSFSWVREAVGRSEDDVLQVVGEREPSGCTVMGIPVPCPPPAPEPVPYVEPAPPAYDYARDEDDDTSPGRMTATPVGWGTLIPKEESGPSVALIAGGVAAVLGVGLLVWRARSRSGGR